MSLKRPFVPKSDNDLLPLPTLCLQLSSQISQSQGVGNKMNRERRRLESAGAASTTVNQIQLSPTNRPASSLLLLLISIQPSPTSTPARTESTCCVSWFYPVGRGWGKYSPNPN